MSYDAVTTDQFFERFPQYAAADEDLLTLLLAEASVQVDNSWIEEDYQTAILYLTAHMLANELAAGLGAAGASGPIQSESFGPMSRSYAISASAMTDEGLEGTVYGRRYRSLRRKSFPGVAVA